jgi:uncharacterized membrane protein YccF (DUF307 family)
MSHSGATLTLASGGSIRVTSHSIEVVPPSGDSLVIDRQNVRHVSRDGARVTVSHSGGLTELEMASIDDAGQFVSLTHVANHPTLQQSMPPTQISMQRKGHGCVVTGAWFIFIGWWLSGIWIFLAWLMIVLIVTMPIGLIMINKLPKIVSLREESTEFTIVAGRITEIKLAQPNMILRACYFVLIGWWFSLIWMSLAWLVSITLIGLPLAIWMYNRVPAVTTLKRY